MFSVLSSYICLKFHFPSVIVKYVRKWPIGSGPNGTSNWKVSGLNLAKSEVVFVLWWLISRIHFTSPECRLLELLSTFNDQTYKKKA